MLLQSEVLAKINLAIRADGEITLSRAVGYAMASGFTEKDATREVKNYMARLVECGGAKRRRARGLAEAWIAK